MKVKQQQDRQGKDNGTELHPKNYESSFLSRFIFATGHKYPQHVCTVPKTMTFKPNWNLEAVPQ